MCSIYHDALSLRPTTDPCSQARTNPPWRSAPRANHRRHFLFQFNRPRPPRARRREYTGGFWGNTPILSLTAPAASHGRKGKRKCRRRKARKGNSTTPLRHQHLARSKTGRYCIHKPFLFFSLPGSVPPLHSVFSISSFCSLRSQKSEIGNAVLICFVQHNTFHFMVTCKDYVEYL